MQYKETFGQYMRRLREERRLPIRKVAAYLDIDPSTLSKIERDERSANKTMIDKLAELFDVEKKELLITFLSDKVAYDLSTEEYSGEILKIAEQKIKYWKSKSVIQSKMDF